MKTCEYVQEGQVCDADAEYYPAVKKWYCERCIENVRLEMAAEYGHADSPETNSHPFSERQIAIARDAGFIVTDDFRVKWSAKQIEDIHRRAEEMHQEWSKWTESDPVEPG